MGITTAISTVVKFVSKNRRIISTILAVSSVTATVISAIKDTPKARINMVDAINDKGDDLTKFEEVKVTAKSYWKTIALFTLSIGIIVTNTYADGKQFASLASAYAIAERRLSEHKDAVLKVVGEKKAAEVESKIVEQKMEQAVASNVPFINTGNGTTLFFDEWSGRYFYSDIEKVRRAVNRIDRELTDDDYVSLDEFYWELGLPESVCGSYLGWSSMNTKSIDVIYGSKLTEDDKSCVTIRFKETPYYNFDS